MSPAQFVDLLPQLRHLVQFRLSACDCELCGRQQALDFAEVATEQYDKVVRVRKPVLLEQPTLGCNVWLPLLFVLWDRKQMAG